MWLICSRDTHKVTAIEESFEATAAYPSPKVYLVQWEGATPQLEMVGADGTMVPADLDPTWANLELRRSAAERYVEDWRSRQRDQLGLSNGRYQEMVYSGKLMMAQRFLDGKLPAAPFQREAAARNMTETELATFIVTQGNAWMDASDTIEASYVVTMTLLEDATLEEIDNIINNLG